MHREQRHNFEQESVQGLIHRLLKDVIVEVTVGEVKHILTVEELKNTIHNLRAVDIDDLDTFHAREVPVSEREQSFRKAA